jgi:hypothetical protein
MSNDAAKVHFCGTGKVYGGSGEEAVIVDLGRVDFKPRDLGNDRGYRVAGRMRCAQREVLGVKALV